MYQNYIEIRVYGCEVPPCKLPKFVPIRIFALEYIWQVMNMDELHFVLAKKKSQFKLKGHIGPFVCNTRVETKEAGLLLKHMQFKLSFTWSYDILGIISKLRVE